MYVYVHVMSLLCVWSLCRLCMLDEDLEEPHEQNQKILYNHGQTICLSAISTQQIHTHVRVSGATGWPMPAPLSLFNG